MFAYSLWIGQFHVLILFGFIWDCCIAYTVAARHCGWTRLDFCTLVFIRATGSCYK